MNRCGDGPPVVLRCTGIDVGECRLFRVLSASYFGLFTHWVKLPGKKKGRSVYCPGDGCKTPGCKLTRIWRGYIATLEWLKGQDCWYPQMLEITEHAELDLRGIYQAGQLWEFFRNKPEATKNSPVQARLLEQAQAELPIREFDIGPTLKHLYHVNELAPHCPNPLPPRTVVQVQQAPPPPLPKRPAEAAPEPMSLEMRQELRRRAQGHFQANGKAGAH